MGVKRDLLFRTRDVNYKCMNIYILLTEWGT